MPEVSEITVPDTLPMQSMALPSGLFSTQVLPFLPRKIQTMMISHTNVTQKTHT